MSTEYGIKCGNCGFGSRARSGSSVGGKLYLFYGCPKCEKIITFNLKEMSEEEKKSVKQGICPGCGGRLIDYKSEEQQEKLKNEGGYTCPRCKVDKLNLTSEMHVW